ncbi:MAG: sigma-70 family RNA polymerase sigma factor [Calditrichaceae bacterium]|jgi:RNA polymerase sigma-70 factor, ECF subfamily
MIQSNQISKSDKEELFIRILKENKDRVYRLCLGYLIDKQDVDDLFQDVMVNIWRGLDSFRGEAKASTWVYRIAVNTSLIYNKKIKRKQQLIGHEEMDNLVDQTSDNAENNMNVASLRKSISGLKKPDRLIITLLLEGMSYQEIADITGISINYVGVKINRIKKQLEKMING